MKNKKEKYNIYKAFDSLTTPDQITKQRIFNSVVNKEKKKVFKFRNLAVPAVAMALLCVNINLLYTSVNNNSVSNNSSDNGVYTEITPPLFSASEAFTTTKTSDEKHISKVTEVPETIIVNGNNVNYTNTTTAIQHIAVSSIQTTKTAVSQAITEAPVTENIPQTELPVATTVPETQKIVEEVTSEKEKGELLPPVSDDLQQLFLSAYNLYVKYSSGGCYQFFAFKSNENGIGTSTDSISLNGMTYYLIDESYFTDIQGVYDYFHQYFTDNMFKIEDFEDEFIEYNGKLYGRDGGKGVNMGYAGHTYQITNQTDNEIDITATCYIYNNMNDYSDELFFETPDDVNKYYIIERSIVFKKENGIWRVDKLELMW